MNPYSPAASERAFEEGRVKQAAEGQGLIVRILEDWAIRESRLIQDSDFPLAVDQKTPEQEARVMGSSLGPIRPSR